MRPSKTFVYCPDCKSMTQPSWGIHWCRTKKGKVYEKRKWDSKLQCWTLDTEERKEGTGAATGQYFDTKTMSWVAYPKLEPTFQSCEIPPKETKMLGPGDPAGPSHSDKCSCYDCKPLDIKTHYHACICTPCNKWRTAKGITQPFTPTYPWEGVDRTKWPNTFAYLLKFHFHRDEDRGEYIQSDEYRDRIINHIYKPRPKHRHYYTDHEDMYDKYRSDGGG